MINPRILTKQRKKDRFETITGVTDTRKARGWDFSEIGGKRQRHGSALTGASVTGCEASGLKTPDRRPKRLGVAPCANQFI